MSNNNDLRDSLYREMLASKRAWSASEIARRSLKIVSGAAPVDALVGAILSSDPRFRRDRSGWRACAKPAPRLDSIPFLLVDVPQSHKPGVAVPLFFQRFDRSRRGRTEILEVSPDGSGLDKVGGSLTERLGVSLSAPAARRALHRLELVHALPTTSDRLIDLAAVLRVIGTTMPDSHARDSTAPTAERLHACWSMLDAVLDTHGDSTLEDLERLIEKDRRGEPVDFSRFGFQPELLDEIPARPGIYRFLGDGGKLLYVGKSRDLSRRVGGYFRPIAPDHTRRRELLDELRDIEWEVTPSELEAQILEAEAIRSEQPLHNRQIDLHESGESLPAQDADLACVLCEDDPEEVSLFFLRDGQAWARTRLPRGLNDADLARLESHVKAWTSGDLEPGEGLTPIGDPEGLLVLRFLTIFGDTVDRVRLTDFSKHEQIVRALAGLATRERPDADSWLVRSPSSEKA